MNTILSSVILGAVVYFISNVILRLIKLSEGQANVTSLILTFVVSFLWGNEIKSTLGLADEEIRLTEMYKPFKVYKELSVSDVQLTKAYLQIKKSVYGYSSMDEKKYIIEYTFNVKNNGDPIIPMDDPSGNRPIEFNESLVLRNMDGIDGKEDYINFAESVYSELSSKAGDALAFSTPNPIKKGEAFKAVGKIALDEEDFKVLTSERAFDAFLYITFTGTTKEKYNDPNDVGLFIIGQEEYKINLSEVLKKNKGQIETIYTK